MSLFQCQQCGCYENTALAEPPRWAAGITLAGTTWTSDANKALRFSRKEDAAQLVEHVRKFESRWVIEATEHIWCGPPEDFSWYEGKPDKKVIADIVRLKQEGKL